MTIYSISLNASEFENAPFFDHHVGNSFVKYKFMSFFPAPQLFFKSMALQWPITCHGVLMNKNIKLSVQGCFYLFFSFLFFIHHFVHELQSKQSDKRIIELREGRIQFWFKKKLLEFLRFSACLKKKGSVLNEFMCNLQLSLTFR